MNELYSKIHQLCTSIDMTVSQLCKEVGISRSAMSELKSGRSKSLSVKNLAHVADYFNVPTEFLYGEGVFSNWDEIIKHIDPVFSSLRNALPRNLFWEDKDETVYRHLDKYFYYGNDIPLFVNWLYESVQQIIITQNSVGLISDGQPEFDVEFIFRARYQELLDEHFEKEMSESGEIKATSIYDAFCNFIAQRPKEGAPTENQGERISTPLAENESELLEVYKKLNKSRQKQLIGKAYELLDAQEGANTGDEAISPPNVDLVATLSDNRVKK